MKHVIPLILAAATQLQAFTLTDRTLTTTVTQDGGTYHYEFSLAPHPLDGKHDVGHVSITLHSIEDIFNAYASAPFTAEFTPTTFKWDDIEPEDTAFVFGFSSLKGPETASITVKASTLTETFSTYRPGGEQIPEPSSALLGVFAAMSLLRRRR